MLEGTRFVPVMPDAEGILHFVAVAGFRIDVNWLWPEEHFVPVRQALARTGAG